MASGMATAVSHSQCGIYIVASPRSDDQILVNGLTGEKHNIQRSADMIQSQLYYQISFNKAGAAYLSTAGDKPSKLWLSGMKLSKAASCDTSGRVAIVDVVTGEKVWADDTDEIQRRVTRTMRMSSKWSVPASIFNAERSILLSRLGPNPHQIGGSVFWEFRCLREILDFGGKQSDDAWCKNNFYNVFTKWQLLYEQAGGVHPWAHWLVSQKSWVAINQAHMEMLSIFSEINTISFNPTCQYLDCCVRPSWPSLARLQITRQESCAEITWNTGLCQHRVCYSVTSIGRST